MSAINVTSVQVLVRVVFGFESRCTRDSFFFFEFSSGRRAARVEFFRLGVRSDGVMGCVFFFGDAG